MEQKTEQGNKKKLIVCSYKEIQSIPKADDIVFCTSTELLSKKKLEMILGRNGEVSFKIGEYHLHLQDSFQERLKMAIAVHGSISLIHGKELLLHDEELLSLQASFMSDQITDIIDKAKTDTVVFVCDDKYLAEGSPLISYITLQLLYKCYHVDLEYRPGHIIKQGAEPESPSPSPVAKKAKEKGGTTR